MQQAIIEIEDLWFSYHGTVVLENVDLSLQQGDFMAVIGPNGGGKTTLLRLILGLLKPDKGKIRVFGEPPRKAVTKIGYVPQHMEGNLGIPLSVFNVVLMGRMRGGGGWRRFTREDRRKTEEVMQRTGIWDQREMSIGELSGGQRQKVMVARALVNSPRLLLLDEPTSSMDTQSETEFYQLLYQINDRVTIVVVSHDLMVLSSYVKSVACVNKRLYFHDRPEITKDMLEMAYHCPVELIAHGIPHRVLSSHEDE